MLVIFSRFPVYRQTSDQSINILSCQKAAHRDYDRNAIQGMVL